MNCSDNDLIFEKYQELHEAYGMGAKLGSWLKKKILPKELQGLGKGLDVKADIARKVDSLETELDREKIQDGVTEFSSPTSQAWLKGFLQQRGYDIVNMPQTLHAIQTGKVTNIRDFLQDAIAENSRVSKLASIPQDVQAAQTQSVQLTPDEREKQREEQAQKIAKAKEFGTLGGAPKPPKVPTATPTQPASTPAATTQPVQPPKAPAPTTQPVKSQEPADSTSKWSTAAKPFPTLGVSKTGAGKKLSDEAIAAVRKAAKVKDAERSIQQLKELTFENISIIDCRVF